ncbi:S8 family serine peptidase [candidate division KSB1 bacterium]|nr:S8 family serine peptidase [candidate division KSB1 bacterium]
MKRYILVILIHFLFFAVLLANSNAINDEKNIIPGQLIIKFKPQVQHVQTSQAASRVFNQCQAIAVEPAFPNINNKSSIKRTIADLSRIYQVQVPENLSIMALCSQLKNDPSIEYVEPLYWVKTRAIPNDEYYNRLGHLTQIMAPKAWDVVKGVPNVLIAVIDTGVDWDHPDLAPSIWRNDEEVLNNKDDDGNGYIDDLRGWDFVVNSQNDAAPGEDGSVADNDPMDFDGHGTHCAGLAAAATNNEIGVASISWGCSIMPVRVAYQNKEGNGVGNPIWIKDAFKYAADKGATVISYSMGGGGGGQFMKDAARYAFQKDVIIVHSAGNDNVEVSTDDLDEEPYVITVAAVDAQDRKAYYSSYGDWITLSAPGGNNAPGLYSTYFNDRYIYASGTSMAAPVTAGLVGLVKSLHPAWTAAQLIYQVVETADNIDNLNPTYAGKLGKGRINAFRAVSETIETPDPKIQILSYSVQDQTTGNGNGIVDIGEKVQVSVTVKNSYATAYNTKVTLKIDDWAVKIEKGTSDLGTIYGIENLNKMTASNANDPFIFSIDPLALPHQARAVIEFSANTNYKKEFEFIFSIGPTILYVDDDSETNGSTPNDVSRFYISALEQLNYSFEHWEHVQKGTPNNLNSFSTVIWNCEWSFPSLEPADYNALQQYLNAGGNLFISGQDIGWDLNATDSEDRTAASQAFYENYLHAKFITDQSAYSDVSGVTGDPISDGLNINIFQPDREPDNQYPDEIKPINGGISIFNFANSNSGAVRYAGDYRVVNFSFGGFEAITNSETRNIVMERIINWLNGLSLKHIPLTDTEDTQNGYEILAHIKSTVKPLQKADLLWDNDGEVPFRYKISMNLINDSTYQAFIPAQNNGKIIYTIFAQNTSGFYHRYKFHSFNVGPDRQAPTISNEKPLPNTLDKAGPYPLSFKITDNKAVDTASVWVYYGIKGRNQTDSLKMKSITTDYFQIQLPGIATYGDTMFYFVEAKDNTQNANLARTPIYKFVIGLEDFEGAYLSNWNIKGNWGLEMTEPPFGNFSITDTPNRTLSANEEHILELSQPLDLAGKISARLTFWTKYSFHRNNAFGYVEISLDEGVSWEIIQEFTSLRLDWGQIEISLDRYVQQKPVRIRFRTLALSTSNNKFDGWMLDDILIKMTVPVSDEKAISRKIIPTEFRLLQNYPNPFNPETRISYELPITTYIYIRILNMLGQEIKTLVDQNQMAGQHAVIWDGTNNEGHFLPSGIYFYQMQTPTFKQTRKLVWIK